MNIRRLHENPLFTPEDVEPYHPHHEVIGVFNAGVAEYKGEILLLLRIAERPVSENPSVVGAPLIDFSGKKGELTVVELDGDDPTYDFSDPRAILWKDSQHRSTAYLTSISYIRIARSRDGRTFTLDPGPFIYPETEYEAWGIEDPRVTQIEQTYYIQYSAVSEKGIAVGLISTTDFVSTRRLGLILHPENKDVAIFPEKINGKYYALHRPVPKGIGKPEIWIAESPDLIHWGNHRHLLGLSEHGWESGRIGGGAVPIKTDRGWLEIYHAADRKNRYCLGGLLLDLNDPSKVVAKTKNPILEPEAEYETDGFFGDVVFACGLTVKDDRVRIYYGAADTSLAAVDLSLNEIMAQLSDV